MITYVPLLIKLIFIVKTGERRSFFVVIVIASTATISLYKDKVVWFLYGLFTRRPFRTYINVLLGKYSGTFLGLIMGSSFLQYYRQREQSHLCNALDKILCHESFFNRFLKAIHRFNFICYTSMSTGFCCIITW